MFHERALGGLSLNTHGYTNCKDYLSFGGVSKADWGGGSGRGIGAVDWGGGSGRRIVTMDPNHQASDGRRCCGVIYCY